MQKDVHLVWESCVEIIKDILDYQQFNTWFEPIKPVSLNDEVLVIEVPSQFFYEYIEEYYASLITKTLRRVINNKEAKLEYRIFIDPYQEKSVNYPAAKEEKYNSSNNDMMVFPNQMPKNINPFLVPGINRYSASIDSQLNKSYTFDNLIEGDFNRVARKAGLAVAQRPGHDNPFNPLIVYGGSGLGKTHLAHAIGNEIKRINSSINVLYVSTETFINQFISHAKANSINVFINVYQSTDVLIIDDVHNFAKADKSQDAFFTIFNHLHQSGKQLVLTSDRAPKDLMDLQDRLLSRFKWGLMTDLQCPDYESRIAILTFKMKKEGLEIPEKVIQYLAYNISTNVRELEGAMVSLLAQSSLNKKEIDIELAKKVLKNIIDTKHTEISIENIQKIVCEHLSIEEQKLKDKTRKREVVLARHLTMYLSRSFTKNSLKTIGEHFGGRDHTTVIHACQVIKDTMDTDHNFKMQVQTLEDKLQIALH